ncbi:S1 RNA-binding domain-containing protein [Candidatus Uhrbacteria bacterium]|jgi:small subunit ribosomal protein S1|nr:S1 RNA-binding domain-containing protein [Candidatus Uhrbacteria bacterium]
MSDTSELHKLLEEQDQYLAVPGLGDLISATVLSTKGREIRLDVNGLMTGTVRGKELFTESGDYSNLQPGDKVEATVIDLENENGEVELSFRYAGNKKAWEEMRSQLSDGEVIDAKVLDANKGGLIMKVRHLQGFLPVSQLAPEHYPRVSGGDKQKILDKLREFVGQKLRVKILDLHESDEKLIVSEKAVWESEQKNIIDQISVGQDIEGEITALADFGAFVKFYPKGDGATALEGLVHISEIAWQRIDHPKDLLKVHQSAKAQIIGIEGSKIFLSMKKLIADPWQNVESKYQVGDVVEGTILKVNPFGFFVELDADIHGLAHVSELSSKPVTDPKTLGKAGEKKEFKIVSIEPAEHRLGLSLKAMEAGGETTEKAPKAKKKKEAEVKEEAVEEVKAEEVVSEDAATEEVKTEKKEEETKE